MEENQSPKISKSKTSIDKQSNLFSEIQSKHCNFCQTFEEQVMRVINLPVESNCLSSGGKNWDVAEVAKKYSMITLEPIAFFKQLQSQKCLNTSCKNYFISL